MWWRVNPWTLAAGFAVSIIVGYFIVHWLVRWMWRYSGAPESPDTKARRSLGWLLGIVERTLYTGSLLLGWWQVIVVWLALKVAVRWNVAPQHRGADNIWLIGTGLSLLFGFIGAWIALAAVPILR